LIGIAYPSRLEDIPEHPLVLATTYNLIIPVPVKFGTKIIPDASDENSFASLGYPMRSVQHIPRQTIATILERPQHMSENFACFQLTSATDPANPAAFERNQPNYIFKNERFRLGCEEESAKFSIQLSAIVVQGQLSPSHTEALTRKSRHEQRYILPWYNVISSNRKIEYVRFD